MSTKNTGGPAFPVEGRYDENGEFHGAQTGNARGWATGLTIRDHFAGLAMQGLLRMDEKIPGLSWGQYDTAYDLASDAYTMADAMLKQRDL
jgi:hypothetical protein